MSTYGLYVVSLPCPVRPAGGEPPMLELLRDYQGELVMQCFDTDEEASSLSSLVFS